MLLYKFGGFYMDLDIECHKPMDALRAYPFIMPQTRPVGFSNDFLASTPGGQPSACLAQPLMSYSLKSCTHHACQTCLLFISGVLDNNA